MCELSILLREHLRVSLIEQLRIETTLLREHWRALPRRRKHLRMCTVCTNSRNSAPKYILHTMSVQGVLLRVKELSQLRTPWSKHVRVPTWLSEHLRELILQRGRLRVPASASSSLFSSFSSSPMQLRAHILLREHLRARTLGTEQLRVPTLSEQLRVHILLKEHLRVRPVLSEPCRMRPVTVRTDKLRVLMREQMRVCKILVGEHLRICIVLSLERHKF